VLSVLTVCVSTALCSHCPCSLLLSFSHCQCSLLLSALTVRVVCSHCPCSLLLSLSMFSAALTVRARCSHCPCSLLLCSLTFTIIDVFTGVLFYAILVTGLANSISIAFFSIYAMSDKGVR
jgi:hypothetical protein